jgi:azurin
MKNLYYTSVLFVFVCGLLFLNAGCGNSETPKTDEPKTKASDLFTDNRPPYDAKKIDPAAEVTEITISAIGTSMSDMAYDQKKITIKNGSTVKLKFINTFKDAAMPHNWVLVYDGTMEDVATKAISAGKDANFVPSSPDVLVATKLLGPLEETELVFPAPAPGKYQFVCTYPGHWSLMNGELIVE